jgi:hypothetical protein
MDFQRLSKKAFKRVLSDPKKYDVDIRPLKDCFSSSPKWREMSGLIVRVYHEYKKSIPIPILTEIFLEVYSDLSIIDERGEIVCKLKYNKPPLPNIFGTRDKVF